MERLPTVSRRTVLVNAAGVALGAGVLASCASGRSTPAAGTPKTSSPAEGAGSGGASGGEPLAQLADVPVGGAVSATDAAGKPVIVAQPTKGTVVAFSAICTHMGCTVAPAGGILKCPCHGSTYDLATGENTGGPAPKPLPEIQVSVKRGSVVEG